MLILQGFATHRDRCKECAVRLDEAKLSEENECNAVEHISDSACNAFERFSRLSQITIQLNNQPTQGYMIL